jgi:periplasmic protein CpxP/Spy
MLSTRWHNLLSIITTTCLLILIIHISPGIASFKISLPIKNNYLLQTTTIADSSLVTNKQNPSSLLEQLNLTNNQNEQIQQIHRQYKQQILKKKNNLARLQQQLSDLMVGTNSVELIRAKNKQLVDLRTEIGELRFESMLATREILTPQQRQKFRDIIESQLAP